MSSGYCIGIAAAAVTALRAAVAQRRPGPKRWSLDEIKFALDRHQRGLTDAAIARGRGLKNRSLRRLLRAVAASPPAAPARELLRDNVLRRLVAIERQLGLVEQHQAPRLSRRRPLG